ncbi:MAG: A/G-specific adenine glycosylase [Ginsengibacter sp.]
MTSHDNQRSKIFFTVELLKWNKLYNNRQMPWKNEKNPYKIWISEIILQQTRVKQGMEYYKRFISAYPTIQHIVDAKESNVFKLWEGLGYYSRCKNIIASAKYIVNELNGKFPETFEGILQLKGVGNYTASAIASFAYNHPHAVLDGNVFRVLSRFFGIHTPIDGKDKSIYNDLANELLQKKAPAIYNQAIMDFGATICTPKIPLCNICPLHKKCFAFLNSMVNTLPVKEKTITRKFRWLYYLLIEYNNKLYVRKRITNDIWQNLNEFVLIETKKPASIRALQNSLYFKHIFNSVDFTINSVSKIYKQQLTHQTITGQFIKIKIEKNILIDDYRLISCQQIDLLPFPKFITTYLKD